MAEKTLIAIPAMDSVPTQFAHSLAILNAVGETTVAFQIGSLVYTSRNDLAKKAMSSEADYILWLDSDMVFPPDLLTKLMSHMSDPDVDFVTGLYYRRVAPYSPVLFSKLEQAENGFSFAEYDEIPDEPFEVAGCGFGAVLMRTSVAIDVAINNSGRMFDPLLGAGEDLSFCWRARQLGHKIICDPSVSLGHVGHTIITREFASAYNKSRRMMANNDGSTGKS